MTPHRQRPPSTSAPHPTPPRPTASQRLPQRGRSLPAGIISGGHSYAARRLGAQRSLAGALGELTGGLSYLEFIRGLAKKVESDDGWEVRGGAAGLVGSLCRGPSRSTGTVWCAAGVGRVRRRAGREGGDGSRWGFGRGQASRRGGPRGGVGGSQASGARVDVCRSACHPYASLALAAPLSPASAPSVSADASPPPLPPPQAIKADLQAIRSALLQRCGPPCTLPPHTPPAAPCLPPTIHSHAFFSCSCP
jgi:hypothetical protein